MISIENLVVRYDQLTAVDGISLSVPDGHIFGLLGPNGAGKTTTIKVLSGLLLADGGKVSVGGRDVVTERDAVQRSIGYMADFFGVYDYLTAQEYLSFFGGVYGLSGGHLEARITDVLEKANIAEKRHAYIRTLSRGMKQRLYFARALIHEPQLLILDEPASGMDPRGRAELVASLKELNERKNTTILMSSHILGELQDLCTSVSIMEKGKLICTKELDGSRDSASTRSRVALWVAHDDVAKAAQLLEKRSEVSGIDIVGDRLFMDAEDDDVIVGSVVKHLVDSGVCVLLPKAETTDLQSIFLDMTKGELM
jgi:ABC-2 type transport system ATP-binding protein